MFRFSSVLQFTVGKVFEDLGCFVYLMGFLCDHLRGSVSSFVFLNFIFYLHHGLLDRSEAPFILGTCTSSDISSGGHKKKKANKCSRHNPFLGYNYFFKGA